VNAASRQRAIFGIGESAKVLVSWLEWQVLNCAHESLWRAQEAALGSREVGVERQDDSVAYLWHAQSQTCNETITSKCVRSCEEGGRGWFLALHLI